MVAFLAPLAIGLGSKLISSAFSKRGQPATSTTQNRFLSALNPQQRQADTAENYYLSQAMQFDPSAALEEYGQAAYGDFEKGLKHQLTDLTGAEVGAGRLDTGYYDEDRGRLITDLADQYQRDLASHAMEGVGLKLRATEGVGQFGQNARNTYLDMLSGQLDRETAQRNAKRQMWTDLIGSGLGAAATYFGSRGGGG